MSAHVLLNFIKRGLPLAVTVLWLLHVLVIFICNCFQSNVSKLFQYLYARSVLHTSFSLTFYIASKHHTFLFRDP